MTAILEAAPGIRLIRLPLSFELEHVHVGLVELEDGYLLIDAGMTGEKSFHALSDALDRAGVAWAQVKLLLATHMHPDHIGGVTRALPLSGARLLIHRAELDQLNDILAGDTSWVEAAFAEGGVPRSAWKGIRASLTGMRGALPAIQPDRLLEGGEIIPTAIGDATVIFTPGHSAGHICLYWPGRRLLYAGDHMIETITPNISWMPGQDMLGQYLESLDKVSALDVELVISSHGNPFGNHRQWVAATRAHHEERCEEILRHLSADPRTACELVPVLWDREFSSFDFYFALFEVLAHLEYMRRRGQAGFDTSEAGVRRWFHR